MCRSKSANKFKTLNGLGNDFNDPKENTNNLIEMKMKKNAIAGMLLAMILSFSMICGIEKQKPQEWGVCSYLAGQQAEKGSLGEAVSETLTATFGGAASGMIIGGAATIATGGGALIAWGIIVVG